MPILFPLLTLASGLGTFITVLLHAPGSYAAATNVSVDDSSPDIRYYGPDWSRTGDGTGGGHFVTASPAAYATIKWKGSAIYYMSPKWPYPVGTTLTLDSLDVVEIDLQDPNPDAKGLGATVDTAIVWSAKNLDPNREHELRITIGKEKPYAIVDQIIYTVVDNSENPSSKPHVPVAIAAGVGAAAGIIGLLVFFGLVWFFRRKRQRARHTKAKIQPTLDADPFLPGVYFPDRDNSRESRIPLNPTGMMSEHGYMDPSIHLQSHYFAKDRSTWGSQASRPHADDPTQPPPEYELVAGNQSSSSRNVNVFEKRPVTNNEGGESGAGPSRT